MLDKQKINIEISKKTREHALVDTENCKFSDGYFTGYIKALIELKKGKYNI